MRVVVDTSVVFSAFAFRGRPLQLLNSIQDSEDWELVISPEMSAELKRVLEQKQKCTKTAIQALDRYLSLAIVETPTTVFKVCRDAKDDMVINCALAAGAELLLSSDNDLLVLSRSPSINGLEVVNVAEGYARFVADEAAARST